MARTWEKPPPSPLEYTLCLATGPAPKCHFVLGLTNGSPEIPTIRTTRSWGPITLRVDLRLKWGTKKNCNPPWELSNNMLHTTCTQGNWGDSQLLVIGSQTVNLTIWLPALLLAITCVSSVQMGHASPF
jgi:hypothetical protein